MKGLPRKTQVDVQPGDEFRAGKRIWTPFEDEMLRARFPHEPTSSLARDLRRTVYAVYARADKFNLRKTAEYLASPHACRLRRGDSVGASFRFKKGQTPSNKGLRRPGWHRGRMKETQFKKGALPRNNIPVGSTRLVDGYVYRKVSDVPYVPYTVNWKPEHHLIWVAARGPIPDGFALRFINGDRLDVRLDNLELVSRQALMQRNTIHNLPPALKETVQLLGRLNRQIRKRSQDEKQD